MDEPTKYREDYIAVPNLKTSIKNMLAFLADAVALISRSIRYHIGTLLCFFLLGGLLGYGVFMLRPRLFTYSMPAQFTILNKTAYASIIGQLQSLSYSRSYTALAEALHIEPAVAAEIVFFGTTNMDGGSLSADTSTRQTGAFIINIKTRHAVNASLLQDALVGYINTRPYILQAKKGQLQAYGELMTYTDLEEVRMDSLKVLYNRFIAGSKAGTQVYNNAFNPADLYLRSNQLMSQKAELTKWFAADQLAIVPIDSIKNLSNPTTRSWVKYVLAGLFAGLLIGFLIALSKEIGKHLK